MNTISIPLDRIREYLGRLTPQARSSLLVEIERMQLYGEEVSGSDIILAELRVEFRKSGQSHNRAGNPSRHFFKPIEALFVDRSPERANSGQISRGSLSAIWEWINQMLLPTMARDYCDRMKQVIVMNNPHEAKLIAAGFQRKVIKSLEGNLASAEGVESVRSGLGKYTSSRASFDDLMKMMSALRVRDAIAAFNEALPSDVENFDGKSLARVRSLLDAFATRHPEAIPFALTMVGKRLKTPWQLVHLATKLAPGRNAADIAATRYAISVAMTLDHLDDKRMALNQALKSNRVPIARNILIEIYDIERALRVRIDQLDKCDWGRRLDELMAAVASDLKAEFQTLPENIHHVLGSRTLHGRHSAPGLLTNLARKGRNVFHGMMGHGPAG
jgi:hypothetical protein